MTLVTSPDSVPRRRTTDNSRARTTCPSPRGVRLPDPSFRTSQSILMKPALSSTPPAEATAVQPGYLPGVRADSSLPSRPVAYRRSTNEEQRQTVATGDTSGAGIARNAFYLVVGQAATTALAIVLSAALGRSLGPGDFGMYYLITTMS